MTMSDCIHSAATPSSYATSNNYKDAKHYGEWVNSQMLQWMKNDEYRITEENLAEYEKNADDLIKSYDYDQLFK